MYGKHGDVVFLPFAENTILNLFLFLAHTPVRTFAGLMSFLKQIRNDTCNAAGSNNNSDKLSSEAEEKEANGEGIR